MSNQINILGVCNTPGKYDEEGNQIKAGETLPGFHVISTAQLVGLDEHLSMDDPQTVFSGVDTWHYVFEDEAEALEKLRYDEEAGYQVEFESVPEPVPASVTMRQAKLALLQAGLLSAVSSSIETIEDETQKQAFLIEWEYAWEIERSSKTLAAVSCAAGLTAEQVDELFIVASKL